MSGGHPFYREKLTTEQIKAKIGLLKTIEDIRTNGPEKRAFAQTFGIFLIVAVVLILGDLIVNISQGMPFGQALMETFIIPIMSG